MQRYLIATIFVVALLSQAHAWIMNVTLEEPENNTWTNQNNDTLAFSFTQYGNETMLCILYLKNETKFVPAASNESVYPNITTTLYANFSLVENTTPGWFWYVNCSNSTSGNYDTSEIFVLHIDRTPPVAGFIPPTLPSGNYSSLYIEGNVSASDANISYFEICVYNSSSVICSKSSPVYRNESYYFNNFTNLVEGIYYLNASVFDVAGNNVSLTEREYWLDISSPLIEFVPPTPANESAQNRNYIEVNVTASDNLAGIDTVVICLYNTTSLIGCSYFSGDGALAGYAEENFTNLPDGIYYLNATVNDTAGNFNITETRVIEIDTVPPYLPQITSNYTGKHYIMINWTNPAPPYDFDFVDVYLDGSLYTTVPGDEPGVIISGLTSFTEYNISFVTRDDAGNTNISATNTTYLTHPDCDDVIDRNFTLYEDILNCTAAGLTITAPVTLDCANHIVTGGGNSTDIYAAIYVISSGVTLRNCKLEPNATAPAVIGVVLDSVSGVKLYNLNITRAISGVYARDSSFSLENSQIGVISYASNGNYGLEMENVSSAVIFNVSVYGTSGISTVGLFASNSSQINITESNFTNLCTALNFTNSSAIVYHNNIWNINMSCGYKVYADLDSQLNLSYIGEGNYWGHGICPGFIPGFDSNDASIRDEFAYLTPSGWLTLAQPDGSRYACFPRVQKFVPLMQNYSEVSTNTTYYYFYTGQKVLINIYTNSLNLTVKGNFSNFDGNSSVIAESNGTIYLINYTPDWSVAEANNCSAVTISFNLTNVFGDSIEYAFGIVVNYNPRTCGFSELTENSTDWSTIEDFTNVKYLTFEIANNSRLIGRINFTSPVNLCDPSTVSALASLGDYIRIVPENVSVAVEALRALNASANITLYNLNYDREPAIYYNGILVCPPLGPCQAPVDLKLWNATTGTLIFHVQHWSYYESDGRAPDVSINLQNGTTLYTGSTYEISFTVTDPHLDSCWYSYDGGANITISCAHSVTLSAVNGDHNICVCANDTAGNVNCSSVYYKVIVKKEDGESCTVNAECIGGYCVHGYCSSQPTYCGDGYCEGSESYSTCPSDCSAPTTSSIVYGIKSAVKALFLKEGMIKKLKVKIREVPVSLLELKPGVSSSTLVKVSVVENVPKSLRKAYRYFSIEVKAPIEEAWIHFHVSKQWLLDNNVSKEKVVLYRLVNNMWQELETHIEREDLANVYYRARSPGFSIFAIGVKEEAEPKEAVKECETNQDCIAKYGEAEGECIEGVKKIESWRCVEGKCERYVYQERCEIKEKVEEEKENVTVENVTEEKSIAKTPGIGRYIVGIALIVLVLVLYLARK